MKPRPIINQSHTCYSKCNTARRYLFFSNQNTVAMGDLVLDDLRCEAGVGFEPRLELLVLVLHLDRAVALGLARSGQGKAARLGIKSAEPLTISGLNITVALPLSAL